MTAGAAGCTRSPDPPSSAPPTASAVGDPAPGPTVSDPAREALDRASTAFREGRLFAPPGDNALEHYATALSIDPGSIAAREALADLFPLAISRVEATADGGDPADAARILELLDRVFPQSSAVGALRERLRASAPAVTAADAGLRAREEREPEPPVVASREIPVIASTAGTLAPSAGSNPTAAAATEPRQAPTDSSVDGRSDRAAANDTAAPQILSDAAPPTRNRTIAADTPESSSAQPPVAATPPRLIERVAPEYPAIARQRRIEGWVELEYVVGADGRVIDVRVLDSHPTRVFEAAAERALRRWRFEPAVGDGGAPQPTVGRTRIDFSLG